MLIYVGVYSKLVFEHCIPGMQAAKLALARGQMPVKNWSGQWKIDQDQWNLH